MKEKLKKLEAQLESLKIQYYQVQGACIFIRQEIVEQEKSKEVKK